MQTVSPSPAARQMPVTRFALRGRSVSIHVAAAIVMALGVTLAVNQFTDLQIFYAAGLAARSGVNPYSVPGFFSPLIVLVYFVPLSLLPLELAVRVNCLICLLAFIVAFWRIARRRPLVFWLLLASPFALFSAYYGNLEWLPLLGAIVNPLAGVWLAVAKPQIGIVLAGVLLLEISRQDGPGRALGVGAGVCAMFALSVAAGMRWSTLSGMPWNVSAFPYSIPLGLALAVVSVVRIERLPALAAAPLLAPYLSPGSWVGVLAFLSRWRWLLAIGVVLSWVMIFTWRARF